MSAEPNKMGEHEKENNGSAAQTDEADAGNPVARPEKAAASILQLPALAAISLYMLILGCVIVVGVVGRHYPPLFLVLAVAFAAASGGLMGLKRWAWSLTLSAVVLLVAYNVWIFLSIRMYSALVQSLLNLVFFLYLVRAEVREKLR
jgi:hypothetical protein